MPLPPGQEAAPELTVLPNGAEADTFAREAAVETRLPSAAGTKKVHLQAVIDDIFKKMSENTGTKRTSAPHTHTHMHMHMHTRFSLKVLFSW